MKIGSSFHAHQSICIWILILTSCILGFPLFYFSVSAVAAAYTLFKVMFLSVLLEVALPFGLGSYFDTLYSLGKNKTIMEQYRRSVAFFTVAGICIVLIVCLTASSLQTFLQIKQEWFSSIVRILSPLFLLQSISGIHRAVDIGMKRVASYKKTLVKEQVYKVVLTLILACVTMLFLKKSSEWMVYSFSIASLFSSAVYAGYYCFKNIDFLKQNLFKKCIPDSSVLLVICAAGMKYLFPYALFLMDLCCVSVFTSSSMEVYYVMLLYSCIGYVCVYPHIHTLIEHVDEAFKNKNEKRIEKEINVSFVHMTCILLPLCCYLAFHGGSLSALIAGNVYSDIWSQNMLLFSLWVLLFAFYSISGFLVYAIKREKSFVFYYGLGCAIKIFAFLFIPKTVSLSYFLSVNCIIYGMLLFLNMARLRNVVMTYFVYFLSKCVRILLVCCGVHGTLFVFESFIMEHLEFGVYTGILVNAGKVILYLIMTYIGCDVLRLRKKGRAV